MRRALILAVLAACAAAGARAAYLEQEPARPGLGPPQGPVPENPLTEAVRRIAVRPGYTYKGLTAYLLEAPAPFDRTAYGSVSEALADGTLLISEKGAGTVPLLVAENRGGRPVLMIAGEVLLGGKQNRILRDDVLLPARSGPVEVPVLCVEKGRWRGRGAAFDRSSSLAVPGVRATAVAGMGQSEVWESVGRYQSRLGVASGTQDLQDVYDSAAVRAALADYRMGFGRCWRPGALGMVVARHGRVVGADIFCNAGVFRKHRDRLLDSYAVDCIAAERDEKLWPPAPPVEVARRFLRRIYRASFTWQDSPGAGRLLRVSGAGLRGAGLVLEGRLLHAGLFPAPVPIVRPMPPVPGPPPIPLPRPQR